MIAVNIQPFVDMLYEADVLLKFYLYCFKAICLSQLVLYYKTLLYGYYTPSSRCFFGLRSTFLFFFVEIRSSFLQNPKAQFSINPFHAAARFCSFITQSKLLFFINFIIFYSYFFRELKPDLLSPYQLLFSIKLWFAELFCYGLDVKYYYSCFQRMLISFFLFLFAHYFISSLVASVFNTLSDGLPYFIYFRNLLPCRKRFRPK